MEEENTDAVTREQIVSELNQMTRETSCDIVQRYLWVRTAYQNSYDFPDFDPCRWEISRCMTFGLYQAAITLTNHFLERILKYGLIYHHSIAKRRAGTPLEGNSALAETQGLTCEGKSLYGDKELAFDINRACSVGLITKDQKNELHRFRKTFRNGFGHADPEKTFQDIRVEALGLRADDGGAVVDDSAGQPRLAELPFAHGLFECELAKVNAPLYFHRIDSLTRQIPRKLRDAGEAAPPGQEGKGTQ